MDFVDITQYNASSDVAPPPQGWQLCKHPNGDIYFYCPELRLITPENVRNEGTLKHITEAYDEYLHELQEDPEFGRLPDDFEVVISDVTASEAAIRMYSRSAGTAYTWSEETGLETKQKLEFWTFVCEYPSHHPDLPPNTEAEFVLALNHAKVTVASGAIFPFSEHQIERIFARYSQLIGQRSEGQNITAQLGWLIGVTMPLDSVGRRVDEGLLASMMNGLHF